MNPFEDLIHELSQKMEITLQPDQNQSVKLSFSDSHATVQIDLDTRGDRLLIGSELGTLPPGPFRDKALIQALKTNGQITTPRGTLAFSEKKDALILFEFLELAHLNGEKLYTFLLLFIEHAKVWYEALSRGELPLLEGEEAPPSSGSGLFGLSS